MANSITSSTTSPFDSLLLLDATLQVSAAFGASATTASTSPVNFNVSQPYPTTANVIVYVYANALTGTSGSVALTLQESADAVTYNNVAIFANPILTATGSVATSTQLVLGPLAKQYLRVSAVTPSGAVPTGSFGINILL